MKQLQRRNFLRGLGVSIALPAFESLRVSADNKSDATAKRFVCVSPNYGMNPGGFFPEKTGVDYEMPTLLKPLEKHRADLTIFTNLDHPGVGGGHGCSNTLLNGVEVKDVRDEPQRLHTLDQLLGERIGQATRFPSLLLGGDENDILETTGQGEIGMESVNCPGEQFLGAVAVAVILRQIRPVHDEPPSLD